MQIEFFGANCLRLKTSDATLVFDDNLQSLGGKQVATKQDIVCATNRQLTADLPAAKIVFDTPGSYEISGILIDGLAAVACEDSDQFMQATIYKIVMENLTLVVLGHVKPKLSDEQLEALGLVDVLFIPVGGGGTLDAISATQIVKDIEPRLVIPTHYHQKGLKFATPQTPAEDFVKALAVEPEFVSGVLKLKKNDLADKLSLKVFKFNAAS